MSSSKIGAPAIPAIRTADVKSLQNAFNAVSARLQAIETALGIASGGVNLFALLATQNDGFVVKASGTLVTRQIETGDEVDVTNAAGAAGNPKISVPFVGDVLGDGDGFVVKVGTTGATRVLIGGSGSGITIHNPDGVAGDPDFTVP